MKRSTLILLALALAVFFAGVPLTGQTPQRVHIVVLGTTDLHGNILPIDYYTDKPDNRGLAKVATLIRVIRVVCLWNSSQM